MITLYTIGFTKKSAKSFFELLINAKIERLIDIRINNSSQLAGFAKGADLEYFMNKICNAKYVHDTNLAPTKELLKSYRDGDTSWNEYIATFNGLLKSRHIAERYDIEKYNNNCFLCTEDTPEQCHRRLVVEYLKKNNPDKQIRIIHLV